MKTRVISGIVIVLALILVLIPGGYVLFGALFLVSLIAFFELTEAFSVHKKEKKLNALEVSGYLSIIIHYIGVILFDNFTYYIISIMIAFLLIMSVFVIMYPEYTSTQAIYTFFAFIYAPVNVSFIYLLRVMPLGQYLAWIPFIAWVCDTCAYFSGRAFGKHKLVPKLSPKKTVEGAIGGVLGSVLVGAAFGYVICRIENGSYGIILSMIIITLVGSIIAQLGDLLASGIKREHDIKDYGKIIPGHGGIMDRFDSVIFVTPCIYLLTLVLGAVMR